MELGLRFLTPVEIARLHAFPTKEYQLQSSNSTNATGPRQKFMPPSCLPHLEFPDTVTRMQRYRLLGNSLNCWVVAELLRCELFEPDNIQVE